MDIDIKKITSNPTYLMQIFNNMNAGVYTTDLNRKIMTWNKGAENITGYTSTEVIGKYCSQDLLNHIDKMDNELCSAHDCPLNQAIMKKHSTKNALNLSSMTKSGRRIWVSTKLAPLFDSQNEVIGGVVIFEDITMEIAQQNKAKDIQHKLLQINFPEDLPLKVNHFYQACEMVGGDLYTFEKRNNHAVFSLVDYVGHGLPAALMSSYYKSIVHSAVMENVVIEDFLQRINDEFTDIFDDAYIGTCIVGEIDLQTYKFKLFSAGHPAPLLVDTEKKWIEKLENPGFPLGKYFRPAKPFEFQLKKSQRFLLYSDGVEEIRINKENFLNSHMIGQFILERGELPGDLIIQNFTDYLKGINYYSEFPDDISIMLIEFRE